ncbi:MAG: TrmH family RNA methyltransferase [Pseudomonadota bacterium]|nr:TrmH family RNA methyltransferase [Pseudomonadota bacterium]
MRLALYEPDMPPNVGAAIRAAACFGAGVDVIGPCGFPLDARDLRRAAMDYASLAPPLLHAGWRAFLDSPSRRGGRLVLMTTRGAGSLYDFSFAETDVILMGRESAGAPEAVHEAADARLLIPMAKGARSLNIAVAAAVALSEARRQTGWA